MSLTCPNCKETIEEPSSGQARFCLRCGGALTEGAAEEQADRLDRWQRVLMAAFGGAWLLLFFVPYGDASYGVVMSWDLLADREGMSHLVSWPLVLGPIFLILGLVRPLPDWLRAHAGALLSLLALIVISGTEVHGGPFRPDLEFVFQGGVSWMLMFAAVAAGLLWRVRNPRSTGARVLLGLGMLLGLIAYLTPAAGDATLVGALLYHLRGSDASEVVLRVLMLVPLFALLIAAVGFRLPTATGDPARPWALVMGVLSLAYLPALLLLYGLLLTVSERSGWYILMFVRLAALVGGLLVIGAVSAAWAAEFFRRAILPRLRS